MSASRGGQTSRTELESSRLKPETGGSKGLEEVPAKKRDRLLLSPVEAHCKLKTSRFNPSCVSLSITKPATDGLNGIQPHRGGINQLSSEGLATHNECCTSWSPP